MLLTLSIMNRSIYKCYLEMGSVSRFRVELEIPFFFFLSTNSFSRRCYVADGRTLVGNNTHVIFHFHYYILVRWSFHTDNIGVFNNYTSSETQLGLVTGLRTQKYVTCKDNTKVQKRILKKYIYLFWITETGNPVNRPVLNNRNRYFQYLQTEIILSLVF